MIEQFDVAIIGAGPAGMAATEQLTNAGLKICVLDEQPAAGGQIYRAIGRNGQTDKSILGQDYYEGENLYHAFQSGEASHMAGAKVWEITRDGLISFSLDGQGRQIRAERVLLATGAQERPMPFPGWTLPGVMTCGAAQIALKASGQVPDQPLVIAGSGPLIFLIAAQLIRAGCQIQAILDTTPKGREISALKHLPGALKGWRYLVKGIGLIQEIRQAGVKIIKHVSGLEAMAGTDGGLDRLRYHISGDWREIETRMLLVHQGVIPNLQMTRALGCDHAWDAEAENWILNCDSSGRSSLPKIFAAGDGRFIMGALASAEAGRLAAFAIMKDLSAFEQQRDHTMEAKARRRLHKHLAIRPFLDALYAPAPAFVTPPDETLICRCEEVTAGQIRDYARMGCLGPNQAKAFGRSGMGPCQGRQCGMSVSALIADERKVSPDEVGYYNIRFPIKPVTLGEVASLPEGD